MYLVDQIKTSLSKYPDLYLCNDYEQTKKQILCHLFLTIGSGFEWANTENKEDGGYLICYDGDKDGYDPPYGTVKYDGPPIERFFQEDYIEIVKAPFYPPKESVFVGFRSEIPDEIKREVFENEEFNIKVVSHVRHLRRMRYPDDFWTPYPCPNGPKYIPLGEIDVELIKDDWLEGMIWIKQKALEFYEKPNKTIEEIQSYGFSLYETENDLIKMSAEGRTISEVRIKYQLNLDEFPFNEISSSNIKNIAEKILRINNEKMCKKNIIVLKDMLNILSEEKTRRADKNANPS
jgi:hypothetical protein